jgi:hypothetical protein
MQADLFENTVLWKIFESKNSELNKQFTTYRTLRAVLLG